jgi:hypothetical protein
VVSAETARRYWGDAAQAIGAVVHVVGAAGPQALQATVVGVARDTANPDIDQPSQPTMYLLDAHRPSRRMQVVARTASPARLAPALRAAIRAIDPDLPLHQLRPVSATVEDGFSSGRLLTGMFAGFAIVALLLAAAGLYGVVSHGVSQRTPEIAVRLALGASRAAIARQIVGGTLRLTLTGVVLGTLGGFALARTMSSVLFGVSATDGPTYVGAAVVSFAAATLATWLPMRRAAAVDPVQSLRQA